jgi:hypothetical protein
LQAAGRRKPGIRQRAADVIAPKSPSSIRVTLASF